MRFSTAGRGRTRIVTLLDLILGRCLCLSVARSTIAPSAQIPGEYVSAQAAVLELRIRKGGEIVVGGRGGVVVGAVPYPDHDYGEERSWSGKLRRHLYCLRDFF